MIGSVLRVLFGFIVACLAAGLTMVLFVYTPAEIVAERAGDRAVEALLLSLAAATQSAIFAAPFALIGAAFGEWQRIGSWLYYVTVAFVIACIGFLEAGEGGLRVVNREYRVALGPIEDPALATLLDEIKLTPQEAGELEAYARGQGKFTVTPAKRMVAFVTLERTHAAARPEREIGVGKLDGVQVSRIFVKS